MSELLCILQTSLCQDAAAPAMVSPNPGTYPAHPRSLATPLLGDRQQARAFFPRLVGKERKTPTLVMIKGWLKSMPPESLKPQGAGPGRTTFWGMAPPGAAFLGWRRSKGQPCAGGMVLNWVALYAPRTLSSLGLRPESFIPAPQ